MTKPWNIGDEVTSAEYLYVVERLWGRRKPNGHPHRIISALVATAPLRLDYEMNRYRRMAYDNREFEPPKGDAT